MKRWVGAAGLSGLSVLVGIVASADAASAAPGASGSPPAAHGGGGQGPPAQAATPAQSNRPATPGKPAAPVRPASSSSPSSPNRATGQARAAQVRSPQAGAGGQDAARAAAAAAPAAPAPAPTAAPGAGQVKVTLCHATGSTTAPFTLITIASPAAQPHLAHGDVAPVGGVCPSAITAPAPGGSVTICHRTTSGSSPFEVITVLGSDLPAHLAHGDVATVGGACPGAVVLPLEIVRPNELEEMSSVRAAVLGSAHDAVEAQSLTEALPLARVAERSDVETATRVGSLPHTGTDLGEAALVGLLLLLIGGRLARSGRLRASGVATAPTMSAGPPADVRAPRRGLPTRRSQAPPVLPPRRRP